MSNHHGSLRSWKWIHYDIRQASLQTQQFISRRNNVLWAEGLPTLRQPYRQNPEILSFLKRLYHSLRPWQTDYTFDSFVDDALNFKRCPVTRLKRKGDHADYRQQQKYRRSLDHTKKAESNEDETRRAWWEHKQFQRDKRHPHCHTAGCKRFYIRRGSRRHRQWVRQQLSRENYDDFFPQERDMFVNPWDWD